MLSRNENRPGRRLRPAATLMEVLALLALLVVITDFTVRMVRMMGGDIPRTYRDFQTETTLQDMLRQLREDVEAASRIGQLPDQSESSDRILSVTLPDRVMLYTFSEGKVSRGPAGDDPNQTPSHVWPVPHAVIEWQLLARDDTPYALEIQTAIERLVRERLERKLRNSHVFFVGLNGAQK